MKRVVWKREAQASAMVVATRRPAPLRGALRTAICAACWMGFAVAAEPSPDAACADDACAIAPPAYTGAPLTLRLQGVPVRGALQQIADFAGLNLVAGDDVAGDMTLRLVDVPWDEALDIVLATNGLDKRRTGNVLLVAPAETLAERDRLDAETRRTLAALAPLETRFVRVRYADASALAALVGDSALALSERGRVLVDERTNSLILTDTADNLEAVERMIGRLDIPVRQVQIEARIVNANSNFSEQMGIRWGVQLLSANGNGEGEDAGQAGDTTRHSAGATVADGAAVVSARVSSPALWLDVELSASVDAGEAEIVARPKVVTTDKQPATIETGVEIPYQQATKSGATSIAFKDAVLQLLVTPRITPNGRIVMDLEVKQDTVGRIYHGVPSINTTRIVTQVLVDDGATLVLGGIFQTDRHHAVTRTPLLGNLPFIGRAFRRTTERDDKQELFIFITPAIIADTGSAAPSGASASGAASSDTEEAA